MGVAIANERLMTDGDAAFLRVNNRKPAHALRPGEVAAATNCRFEQGKPRPRFGVGLDAWGVVGESVITETVYDDGSSPAPAEVWTSITLAANTYYLYVAGNSTGLRSVSGRTTTDIQPGLFLSTTTTYEIRGPYLQNILALIVTANAPLAYERFNDLVTQTDNCILITDEWRTNDTGRGRAWRILPNNGPQEIPLNGHDVWDRCQLVQCGAAMVLLREGDERHYFDVTNINATTDKITLNCAPSWAVGESKRVQFMAATDGAAILGTTPPASGNYYYARHFSGNAIKLYTSSAAAAADTGALDMDSSGSTGRFYIQLAEDPAPFFGNGAPNLIMQGDELGTPGFEIGFLPVPENIEITDTSATNVDAPNHGLVPGDAVSVSGITVGTSGPYYAYPLDSHSFTLHTDATEALTGLNAISTITPSGTGSVKKTNASGLPLPSCRSGAYVNGRLFAVNGRDTIVVSDPNDVLHCQLYASVLPANQGEAGRVNWILPLGEDAILIAKDLKLIVLAGIAQDTSGWTEGTITGEYGGIAPLAADNVGTDAWFLTRKGVASVIRTVAGEKLGAVRTISQDIPQDLLDIDWQNAPRACSAVWNNRYFIAVPTKGQSTVVNNRILVLNFLNGSLELEQTEMGGAVVGGIVDTGGTVDSWEGRWEGDLLQPFAFARCTIAGEERLTFVTASGLVGWFHDGFDDAGAAIESSITTRGYFGGREVLALRGMMNWESFNPKVTAKIMTSGQGEDETLTGFDELEYDRTKYLTDGQEDYDPNTSTAEQFDAPDRTDYSTGPEELLVGRLDVHQHLTEPFRCRVRGVAPQLQITNTQGSLRLESVTLQAKARGVVATRKT